MNIELYFVGHFKRGEFTHLAAGPFVDREPAEDEINKHKWTKASYQVMIVELPARISYTDKGGYL